MLKQAIRQAVRATGYDIVKDHRRETIHHPFYLLSALISDLRQRTRDEIAFVQAGANDGVTGDPLRGSILRYHLRGLLIEPLPSAFQQLQANYASEPQVCFANCAVGRENGTATLYGADRCASVTPQPGESFAVPVRTLPDLLTDYRLPNPSILVVDVEGLDADIVLSALDAGLRPPVIMYESVHLPRDVQDHCLRRLEREGYAFVDADVDTYAVIEDLMVDTPYFGR